MTTSVPEGAPGGRDTPVDAGRRERLVYTVDFHGAEHFYDVLRLVALLSRETGDDVRVVFLPLPMFGRGKRRAPAGGTGLYQRFRQGSSVVVNRDKRRLTFGYAELSRTSQLWSAMSSLAGAVRIWTRVFREGQFVPLVFLKATYRGTRIGDLAASHALRTSMDSFALSPSPRLFAALWTACFLIDTAEAAGAESLASVAYSMSPEPGYAYAAPHRHLHRLGAHILDGVQPALGLVVIPPLVESDGRIQSWANAQPFPERITSAGASAVDGYFAQRLTNPSRVLPYLTNGHNDNAATQLLNQSGQPVILGDEKVYVVLFLHLFADTQYCFGLDGFEGLADWTLHTIDACLNNVAIAGVLVKPHPSPDYVTYPGDRAALDHILQRCRHEPRVTVLRPDASLRQLCTAGRVIGITHHGSVAEEMVYLGQPVIASTFAPWADRYHFARVWSTLAEYDRLIERISPERWTPPTCHEQEELHRYVVDHRLLELPPETRDVLRLIDSLLVPAEGGTQDGTVAERRSSDLDRIETLRHDDPLFETLLTTFEAQPAVTGGTPDLAHRDQPAPDAERADILPVWGHPLRRSALSEAEKGYLSGLPLTPPTVEWVWGEIDRVWRTFGLNNRKPLDNQPIGDFYRHPVWLMSGVFSATDPVSKVHRLAIAEYVAGLGARSIADYGGGFGILAKAITDASPIAEVTIVDPYPSPVATAGLAADPRIRFAPALADERFDVAIAQDVLEHVADPVLTASRVAAAVRPGGHLVFANCFAPVIACHLPGTFHLRYTFPFVMRAMGLEYLGRIPGASHAQRFRRRGTLDLAAARRLERLSRLIGGGLTALRYNPVMRFAAWTKRGMFRA